MNQSDRRFRVSYVVCGALVGLLSGSLGCGGSQKKADPPPTTTQSSAISATASTSSEPQKPVEVSLRIDALSAAKGALALQPGDTLRSGDQLAISVTVDQPAYVYVAVGSSAGAPQLVFPKTGDQQLSASTPLRIPANPEKWIPLDTTVGQDDVFVYASPQPIGRAELFNLMNSDAAAAKKASAKRLAKAASAPKAAKPAKPPKTKKPEGSSATQEEPGGLSAGSRGLAVDGVDEDEAAPETPKHITAKRFFLIHK